VTRIQARTGEALAEVHEAAMAGEGR
jgi:hypothetical protein